jgi:hypothetical protein
LRANNGTAFDNRGLAHLKLNPAQQAIADFDSAEEQSKLPGSLFRARHGKARARRRSGIPTSTREIHQAEHHEIFARYGVTEILAKKTPPAPPRVEPQLHLGLSPGATESGLIYID